jgi:multidrug resistance efflux pump
LSSDAPPAAESGPAAAPEPPTPPRRSRRSLLRQLAPATPWIAWVGAIVGAVVVGQGLGPQRPMPGEVERRQVTVAAPEAGLVLELKVEPGQRVQAGETLARLDSSALDRELSIALVDLERLTAEVPAQQLTLVSDDQQSAFRLSREVELAALEVNKLEEQLLRAQAELEQLDRQIARNEELLKQRLTTTRALEELQLQRAAVQKRVEAHPQLIEAAKGHVRSARARLAQQQKGSVAGEIDRRLAPMRAAIRAQEERVAQLQARIGRASVKAPVEGIVAEVRRRAGETASLGEPLLTLLDQRGARVVAWVDEHRAQRVALGERALLRSKSSPPSLRTGQVVGLGPAVVQAPPRFSVLPGVPVFARPVYIAVDGAEAVLPGARYDVTLTTDAADATGSR